MRDEASSVRDATARRWDPNQYLRFSGPRLRAALDLLAHISLSAPHRIYDLGCGTGDLTRILAQRWPQATVVGIDYSPEMLAKAALEPSSVEWEEADAATWKPGQPGDLIFSNATFHWLAHHQDLFPRLLGELRPGGVLAVQMPLSWHAPSHRLMRQALADGGPNGESLGPAALRQELATPPVLGPEEYYEILAPHTSELDIWSTEYLHVLEGEDAVLEWVKGTGLRPILNDLDDAECSLFLDEYRKRLAAAYPVRLDGKTVYPFPRLFFIARV